MSSLVCLAFGDMRLRYVWSLDIFNSLGSRSVKGISLYRQPFWSYCYWMFWSPRPPTPCVKVSHFFKQVRMTISSHFHACSVSKVYSGDIQCASLFIIMKFQTKQGKQTFIPWRITIKIINKSTYIMRTLICTNMQITFLIRHMTIIGINKLNSLFLDQVSRSALLHLPGQTSMVRCAETEFPNVLYTFSYVIVGVWQLSWTPSNRTQPGEWIHARKSCKQLQSSSLGNVKLSFLFFYERIFCRGISLFSILCVCTELDWCIKRVK